MSSYGLDSEAKKAVKTTVLGLRELLEGEFDPNTGEPIPPGGDITRQIARYGISVNNADSLKTESAPDYLTDDEKNIRERICAAIKREVSIFGKLSEKAALSRGMRAFIRQTCYTWINRLLGLRCMEARGLLKDEQGEPDYVVTPHDDYGGLPRRAWRIKGRDPEKWQTAKLYDLQCETIADVCRQLTQEIKVLFDPEHDHGLIWPSPSAINTILQKIQNLDNASTPSPFTSPDFLGWVYQYFQTKEKDQVFEAASKKKKKIEKDDIIAATQIYTEHYMVEYLVQNTLCRIWMEMHSDSKLSKNWAYYVEPPKGNPHVERELKKVIELKLMDPAVGSGHFHIVAFDLLYSMYEEEIENAGQLGWPDIPSVEDKKNIPAAILENNLYGIDIDARSIQISSLVLVMKAREYGYDGPINHLNLVVANSAPFESEAWHQYILNLANQKKHSVARVLAALGLQLKNLDEFGSLLRVEDEIEKIIRQEKTKWIEQAKTKMEQDYLFPEMSKPKQQKIPFESAITDETFFDRLGEIIEHEVDTFYRKARREGLTEQAILASDAERGFDFFKCSIKRYDAVYTNPPYMGSKNLGKRLKEFIASSYPDGKNDLYAAFILRCLEMSEQNGKVGMVTQQSWMFLRTFSKMRNNILKAYSLETLAHLGARAFTEISGHVVNCALFTFLKSKAKVNQLAVAYRLVGPKNPDKKMNLLREAIAGRVESIINFAKQSNFLNVPGYSFVYWLSEKILKIIKEEPSLGSLVDVRQGLSSADNQRFIHYFWEGPYEKGWFPFDKGGGYRRWWGNRYWLVDWRNDGEFIKDHIVTAYPYLKGNWGFKIQATDTYFKEGLTYSETVSGCIGMRILVGDGIYDFKSPGLFPRNIETYSILAGLNSRLSSYIIRAFSPTMEISYKYLESSPAIAGGEREVALAKFCVSLKKLRTGINPVERDFNASLIDPILFENRQLIIDAFLATAEAAIERGIFDIYCISNNELKTILSETGIPAGWYPLISGYDYMPEKPSVLKSVPEEVNRDLSKCERKNLSLKELKSLKERLRTLYLGGPESLKDTEFDRSSYASNDAEEASLGGFIPIPFETFLEGICQKLQIHPISIYNLIKEMRNEEVLICRSESKRYTENYLSILILRMLGFQWPKKIDDGESLPFWVDNDGIIPITEGLGEKTLIDRIRKRFGEEFGEDKEASIESEFANIVGKPLERWLEEDFFARHVKQFKNRPISWHIVSDPSVVNHEAGQSGKGKKKGGKKKQKPAFSVMVHYHRFVDGDKGYGNMLLLKNKYLEKLMSQTRSELESLRGKGDDPEAFDRIAELDRKLIELEDFRERLERIQGGKDSESSIYVRWKSTEEQPQGWRPDINDGVKINIAPWERLGMFPVKKIVGKMEMAPD